MMRLVLTALCVFPFMAQASGLELYYDFEDVVAGSNHRTSSLTGSRFLGTFHESKRGKKLPEGTSDTSAHLSQRSHESLALHGGLVWIRNSSSLDVVQDMTVNLWFKSGIWKNRGTFVSRLGAWRIVYQPAENRLYYRDVSDVGNDPVSFSVDLENSAEWRMLTLVKNGTSLTFYLDAEKVETLGCDPTIPDGGDFYIGCSSTVGSFRYNGLLDDFALWSSALTDAQIKNLHQGASPMDAYSSIQLKRTVTTALPDTLAAFSPSREVVLSKEGFPLAVIVETDKEKYKGIEEKLQRVLLNSWGVEFPIMSWAEAKESDKNLILFGAVNASEPLRRLMANSVLGDNQLGYELRTIPSALDWGKAVLYFGGRTEGRVFEGVDQLLAQCRDPEKVPFLIECQGWGKTPTQEELDAMVAEIAEKYSAFGDMKNQDVIQKILSKPVELYRMTGDDDYAATFARMLKIFTDNYDAGCGFRKLPPTFTFHLFPQYIYTVENSPLFTEDDRLRAAEIIRKFTEMAIDEGDMKDPVTLYRLAKQSYLGNHPCFSARSVEASARYLLSRYDYEPAKYWKAVADNTFAGVASHPESPEDAAGYQYLTYRIFMDYAIASGKYTKEFFKSSEEFLAYVEFAKNQFNPLGYTAGYGDAFPTKQMSACPLLKQAMDILEDDEAEYILNLVRVKNPTGYYADLINTWAVRGDRSPPGKHTLGLNIQELTPFKQKEYYIWGLYENLLLDKAVFRSGWDDEADFMSVTGINGAPHGHFDGNGISQYISGNRLWLFEGDYIKKFPYDQNSMVVCRDGEVSNQRKNTKDRRKSRVSQIMASVQSDDQKLALLSLLLEDYNGVDWTRNICYVATNGFWVIDELEVKKEGHYALQCYWRSVGQFDPQPQAVGFVQTPSVDPGIANRFFITEGNGASRLLKSRFEVSHGRKNGNISGYSFAKPLTQYLIQRQDGDYKKDDKVLFANFMQALPGKAPEAPIVHKLAVGVFLAESGGALRLAVVDGFSSTNVNIDAEICFIGPEGIVARGARRIKLGSVDWVSRDATNIFLQVDAVEINGLFDALKASGSMVMASDPTHLSVPEAFPSKQLKLSSPVTKMAGSDDLIAIGDESGRFAVYDSDGRMLFEHQFPKAICAISPVKLEEGTQWVVSVQPENLTLEEAAVYLMDHKGDIVWKKMIEAFHGRNGTASTLFTARINGLDHPPAIIAGSEGWHYYAFNLSGEELWRTPVFHAATVGAAGDMNGDGKDDIAAGNEYYFHSLIYSDGSKTKSLSRSPFDYSVAVCDLNSDGMDEAIFGRGDGYLHVMALPENKYKQWVLNVGGKPVSIVELGQGKSVLAAATDTGVITFIDALGRKTGVTYLPAPVTDMKLWDGKLLATAQDGYAYVMNLQGQVQSKIPFHRDVNSVHPPEIAVAGQTAAFSSGSTVYVVK